MLQNSLKLDRSSKVTKDLFIAECLNTEVDTNKHIWYTNTSIIVLFTQ